MRFRCWFALLIFIITCLLSASHAWAIPPFYTLKASNVKKGFSLRNSVQWQTLPCSEQNFVMRQKLVSFPIFRYKQRNLSSDNELEGYYCWNVRLPSSYNRSLLHFRLIRVFGDVELSINQESIWHQVGEAPARIFDILYQVPREDLNFQLRLRCGESHMCGFRGGFKINRPNKGMADEIFAQTLDFFAFAGIMFCCFFHSIFIILRRRSGAAVSLTFVALALGLRILLTGQGQLVLFTGVKEAHFWRLEIFTLYILMPSVISMIRGLFPAELSKQFVVFCLLFGAAWSLLLPFFSSEHYLIFLGAAYILLILALGTLFWVCYSAYKLKRSAYYPFLACTLTITISTGMEVANNRLNVELNPSFHPLGYFFSIVLMAVLLATRITEAFARVESQEFEILELNQKLRYEIEHLDQKIYERTAELQKIIGTLPTGIINITWLGDDIWKVSSQYSRLLYQLFGLQVNSFSELEQLFTQCELLNDVHFEVQNLIQLLHQSQTSEFEDLTPRIRSMFPSQLRLRDDDHWMEFRVQISFVYHHEKIVGLFLFLIDISSLKQLEADSQAAEEAHREALSKVTVRAQEQSHLHIHEFLNDPMWIQLGPTAYQQFTRELERDFCPMPNQVS